MDELDPAYFFESSKGYLVPFLEPLSLDLEQEQEDEHALDEHALKLGF